MGKSFFKIYMIYTVLLLLGGAAVLVVGNNALNRYEREQEKVNAEKQASYIASPTPTQEVVIVEKYKYMVKLPMSLEVLAENAELTETVDGDKTYAIEASAEGYEVGIRDLYGNEAVLRYGEKLETVDYKMVIPDNFSVQMKNGANASDFITSVTDHEDYKWCYEFADMPRLAEYSFSNALAAPELLIYDNLGNMILPEWENERYIHSNQTMLPKIREDVMTEEEAIRYIKMVSDYMTNDLDATPIFRDSKGNKVEYRENMSTAGLTYEVNHTSGRGFNTLKEYLLPDSYRYNVLKNWGFGEDIWTVSKHKTPPPYSNISISNFVMYGKNVFSIDVSFEKTLMLWSSSNHRFYVDRVDKNERRMFFIKDENNEKWLIADYFEVRKE